MVQKFIIYFYSVWIDVFLFQVFQVVDARSLTKLHGDDSLRAVVPEDLGHLDVLVLLEQLGHFLNVARLVQEVELDGQIPLGLLPEPHELEIGKHRC